MRTRLAFRIRILSVLFILAAALLVLRLYFVQVVHGDRYSKDAEGQYMEASSDILERGEILFMTKDGTPKGAAVIQSGWRIAIQPKEIQDSAAVYEALQAITPVDRERFFASAAKRNDPYEDIAFRVTDDAAELVRARDIPGVLTVRDSWRMYPGAGIGAQVVGFVGFRGESKAGVYGLERYYDDTLTRRGAGRYVNPFAEIFANVRAALSVDPASHEGDVVTAIEPSVQGKLEGMLDEIMLAYSPRIAGGIVMDPKTGSIIAMASRPSFDPNTYNTVADPSVFSNPSVESRYEMGSIMKPLTIAAGIDSGAISPSTTYDDKGFVMKSGKRVSNFDHKGRGVVSMQEVLNQSLNTGVSFAVDRMGKETFARYMRSFALGEETGVDLPGEIPGNLDVFDGNADVDYASASFGQGIAVTPLAMIRALAVLAAGGALPEPHVATAIRYPSGVERSLAHASPRQVLKPETAAEVTDMLVKVFDDALLGGDLKQEHYSIAAKTGTAQMAIPGGGGYYPDRYLHSFFGYFPAHEPRFIVLLFAVEPQKETYASHTLAHPFLELAKFLINYYDLPPDR